MISTVLVTYQSAACVSRCLSSVQTLLSDAEIVVVDNGSRDDTLRRVRATSPSAHVVECGENVGFGRACNIGADAARGSHILFLNPDAVVVTSDERELAELIETRPFGMVALGSVGEGDPRRTESTWAEDYLAHTFAALWPAGWPRRSLRLRRGRALWVSGAMFLVSREEFVGLGGFDERFFLYYEDRDLSRRYRTAGLPIRATDAIRGRHVTGTSSANGALRMDSLVWSLLGWIEYLWIHEGEEAARRAVSATITTLQTIRLGTGGVATLGLPRARRKTRELEELLELLRERSRGDGATYCPDALRLIRGHG